MVKLLCYHEVKEYAQEKLDQAGVVREEITSESGV